MTKLTLPLLTAALLTACSSTEPSGDAKKASDAPKTAPESTAGTVATMKGSPSGAAAASALPGSSAAPGTSAAPSASVAAAPDLGPPVCTRSNEKVWGTGANKLTGLTTKRIDGKLAIGFAFGTDPRVLVIDKDGSAKVLKVKMGDKAKTPDPKEGYRALFRVSPSSLKGDSARAFIDYRDEYKDKRRRVSCGPADLSEDFLAFEGTSWMDMEPKPTGEDKKKLFSWKKLGGYIELRDCRTFVSLRSNETWALGSVLRGTEKEDGTNEWKVVFLIDFGKGDEEIVLHETTLKGDPPKLLTYEIPTSRRAGDKGTIIATRFGGTLMVGVLDKNKQRKGKFKTYRGFPTMPDFARDEEELILTTGIGAGKEKSLKALFIPRDTLEMPAGYTDVDLTPMDTSGDAEASFTSPELEVDSKGQRWLAYVEGPKDKGHLRIAPLDKDLKPTGRAFSVTEGEVYASESRVAALENGSMMIAYIRSAAGKTELVTEQLSCEVKK